jgi:hypothetical protein
MQDVVQLNFFQILFKIRTNLKLIICNMFM